MFCAGFTRPVFTPNMNIKSLFAIIVVETKTGSRLSRGNRVPSVRDRHGSSPLPVRASASAAARGHDASVGHTRRASRAGNSCRKPSVDQTDRRGTFCVENQEARKATPRLHPPGSPPSCLVPLRWALPPCLPPFIRISTPSQSARAVDMARFEPHVT